jgi:hypothetical protein
MFIVLFYEEMTSLCVSFPRMALICLLLSACLCMRSSKVRSHYSSHHANTSEYDKNKRPLQKEVSERACFFLLEALGS